MLFKPWRDITVDLKDPEQSWSEAFNRFYETMSPVQQSQVSNIQHFYQCEHSAQQHQDSSHDIVEEEDIEADVNGTDEDDFAPLLECRVTTEDVNGILAVEKAKAARIFPMNEMLPNEVDVRGSSRDGDQNDMENLMKWKGQLTQQALETWRINEEPDSENFAHVFPLHESSANSTGLVAHMIWPEEALSAIKPDMLNIDQRRAYDIIKWHLDRTLAGHQPPPSACLLLAKVVPENPKLFKVAQSIFDRRVSLNCSWNAHTQG